MKRSYTTSDAILDTIKAHGVSHIFGYPGGSVLPFYDVLKHHSEIKHILVRNEQGASFAAGGYARSSKKIGVCIATSGPGATNLITGIADAFLDSIPILCLTGQVPLQMIGNDAFQEVDMTGITLNITKHNYLLDKAENAVEIVSEAIKIACSGRPGPVHIDLPKDIQASPHPKKFAIPQIKLEYDPQQKAFHPIPTKKIDEIIQELNQAKKPVLLIGHGVKLSSAEKNIFEFIQKTNIPVVYTLLAKGIIKDNHSSCLGMLGMHGFYHANMATYQADLILNIGSRFDDRIVGTYDSFAKNKKIIHVDIDQSELSKLIPPDYCLHSDAKQFIQQMLIHPQLKKLTIKSWWEQIKKWQKEHPYKQETKNFTARTCLKAIMTEVQKNSQEYILVTDVGQHQMWAALSCSVDKSIKWLSSGGAGTMGFGLPNAVGAALANPDKTIICIAGDGGMQMNIQELQTIKEYNLNIKICILNNNFLGMVRQWQELFFKNNYSQVFISSPDFVKIGEAYNIESFKVLTSKNITKAHQKVFSDPEPKIIEYIIEKEDNVFPMVPGGKKLNEILTK